MGVYQIKGFITLEKEFRMKTLHYKEEKSKWNLYFLLNIFSIRHNPLPIISPHFIKFQSYKILIFEGTLIHITETTILPCLIENGWLSCRRMKQSFTSAVSWRLFEENLKKIWRKLCLKKKEWGCKQKQSSKSSKEMGKNVISWPRLTNYWTESVKRVWKPLM